MVVINIFNVVIFINLTFRMLLNIHFQKYRYNFEIYILTFYGAKHQQSNYL